MKSLLVLPLLILAFALFYFLPIASYADWSMHFRPAALSLSDPYRVQGVYNPPWAFLLIWPLAILPERAGAALLAMLTAGAVCLYVREPKSEAPPRGSKAVPREKVLLVAASAPFLAAIAYGQLTCFTLLALAAPTPLDALLLTLKPQEAGLCLLRRSGGHTVVILALLTVTSLLLWPGWPVQLLQRGPPRGANFSLFPWSVPLGLALTWYGLRRQSDALLCAATLCLSPYFGISSMLPVTAAATREHGARWGLLAVGAGWLYILVKSIA